MIAVREMRRGLIMTKKRLDLFKYNVKYRLKRGQMYDMRQDLDSFN